MIFRHGNQRSIDIAIDTVPINSQNAGLMSEEESSQDLQLTAMHVAVFQVPRRATFVPIGGDTPFIAVVKAV